MNVVTHHITMLFNIVHNLEQCGQHNIAQFFSQFCISSKVGSLSLKFDQTLPKGPLMSRFLPGAFLASTFTYEFHSNTYSFAYILVLLWFVCC